MGRLVTTPGELEAVVLPQATEEWVAEKDRWFLQRPFEPRTRQKVAM